MASVNKCFIPGNEDNPNANNWSPNASPLPDKKLDNIFDIAIDYSSARKSPLFVATIAATWGVFILGNSIGWSSPCQPQLEHVPNATVPPKVMDPDNIWYMKLDKNQMALVGSLLNLGALPGALCGGFLMDTFGRKLVLVVLSLPSLISWLFIAFAVDPSMLYIGRLLGGFAGGICSVAATSYVGEISIPSMRGILGFSFQVMIISGILMTSLLGLGLDWRLISAILAVFPVILFFSMIFVPESPYHLVKKGRLTDARNSLKWLRGPNYDMEPEMALMQARIRVELAQASRFSDLWSSWAWKQVLVVLSLMVFQQLSGINAATFNAVAIFESAGTNINNLVANVLLNVDEFIVSLLAALLVEHLGRRTLFLISETFMCISMCALGAYFYIKETEMETNPEKVAALGWLPLTSLIIYIAAFAVGAGPIPWIMFGEILPAKVKAPGSSLGAFTNRFLAFIVSLTFVDIQEAIGEAGSFWMFGGFCLLGVFFTIFLLPETKGKSPEQIAAFFGNHSSSGNLIVNKPAD